MVRVWYHSVMPQHPARQRFCFLLKQPGAQLSLAEAALCIAWEDQGSIDVRATLNILDDMAATVRARLQTPAHPHDVVATINTYLFDELGFHGDPATYLEPRNSYLDQVIATRVGLPILLSLVYMEIGKRLQVPIQGVALPGHFIVCYNGPASRIYIDPFNRGRLWTAAECEQQIAASFGSADAEIISQALTPPSKRAILLRILRNLKHAYIQRGEFEHALHTVERLLLVQHNQPDEIRDRGLLRARLGMLHLALHDLEHYTTLMPQSSERMMIEMQAREIAALIAPQN